MKVIFTQDVRGRGQRGQIKEVPDGYAQNYLIKRGLAKQATKAAMSQLKGQQRAEEKHAAEELADAKRMKKILEDDNKVVEYVKMLKPSKRGEYEITDLNRIYLENNELEVEVLGQGFTWLDTGTHESLVEATNFVKTVETHQHRKIACLEEIAYLNGWITKEQLLEDIEPVKKNQYGQYLMDVLAGKYLDKLF